MTDEVQGQAQETLAAEEEKKTPQVGEQPQAESGKSESQDDAGDDDAGEGDEPKKRLSGTRRLKARNERLLAEIADRDSRIEELLKAQPKAPAAGDPPEEADFNGDALRYERAMLDYTVRKAASEAATAGVKSILEETQAQERQRQAEEAESDLMESYVERVLDIKQNIPDFDSTMKEMAGVQIRNDVTREIMSSDKGPLIAYHLAKNPAKLRELHAMTPMELAREIGRLEGSLRMPAQSKQTKAPPPAPKLSGGAGPAFDPSKSTSYADYKAWRFGSKA